MKTRCYFKSSGGFKNYGGKGITIDWENFTSFKEDMFQSYIDHVHEYGEKDTTIDRVDPDRNYSKENCRWATRREQRRENNCDIFMVEYKGKKMPLWKIVEEKGLNYVRVYHRIHEYGWDADKAIDEPYKYRFVVVNGKNVTYKEASEATGISMTGLLKRWRRGLRGEDLIRPVNAKLTSLKKV